MTKIILLVLSVIPLCFQIPYFYQAWSGSRLDHWDWIYYLLGAAAAVWASRGEKFGKWDWTALFLMVPMLGAAFLEPVHRINALSVAGSVMVIFSVAWGVGSWSFAYRFLPAALILLLGTPSSSYHVSLLLNCPVWGAWGIKFCLSMICFIWIWCNKRFSWQVQKGTLFFAAAALATCLLLLHTKELYFNGEAFAPEFPRRAGMFFGRSIEPDENTRRFFATSTVRQYRYTGMGVEISVLSVRCGKDVHEIHPASHCLRTSLWTVHSEQILYLQDNFAVTEIDAQKGSSRYLVWVWFSSKEFSTPSFLGFRRQFRVDGDYFTYQISVPVNGDPEKSRMILQEFITLLGKKSL